MMGKRLRLAALAGAALAALLTTPGCKGKRKAGPEARASHDAALGVRPESPSLAVARGFLADMVRGDYAAAAARTEDKMRASFDAAKIEKSWLELTSQFGAFEREIDARVKQSSSGELVVVRVKLSKQRFEMHIGVDASGRINRFRTTLDGGYETAPYVDRTRFVEHAVTVIADDGKVELPGTLVVPNQPGRFPAVVLMAGSGPNDEDESHGANKPLRDLAEGLASRGIAVLRHYKRTMAVKIDVATFTVDDEYVRDAAASLALLRTRPEIDERRLFVLGHSQGATMAPKVAAQDPSLAGVIALAGPASPFEELIVMQYQYLLGLDGVQSRDELEMSKIRRQAARVKDPALAPTTPAGELPLGLPGTYWLSVRAYDAARTAATLKQPLLLLFGERDYQVPPSEAEVWRKALGADAGVSVHVVPGVNHLFMPGDGGRPRPAEYDIAGHVVPEVIELVTSFIGSPG